MAEQQEWQKVGRQQWQALKVISPDGRPWEQGGIPEWLIDRILRDHQLAELAREMATWLSGEGGAPEAGWSDQWLARFQSIEGGKEE